MLSGKGLKGTIDGGMILSGNQRLMKEHDIDLSPVQAKAQLLASQGKRHYSMLIMDK